VGQRKLLTAVAAAGSLAAFAPPAHAAKDVWPCFDERPVDAHAPGLHLKLIGRRLRELTAVTAAPGSPRRLFVVERAGRVWRMTAAGKFARKPFLDLSATVEPTVAPLFPENNERGMQSIAFPRNYARSRLFYVFTTDADSDSRVMRFRAAPDGRRVLRGTGRTILRVEHSFAKIHYGGQVAFGRDGRLYVSLGEGGRWLYSQQRPLFGKIVSLDPRHPKKRPRVLAKGLRNPFRFSFHPASGRLIVGDVGEASYEEVDVLNPRRRTVANLGWPFYEGPRHDSPEKLAHYVPPRLAYPHRDGSLAAVIGGRIIRDRRLKRLRGRYVFGDLCGGWLATARIDGKHPKIRRTGLRIASLTSFGEDAAGRVYVTSQRGTVYRLDPAKPSGSG
jgi:glucose/arabinose dehydrogenase